MCGSYTKSQKGGLSKMRFTCPLDLCHLDPVFQCRDVQLMELPHKIKQVVGLVVSSLFFHFFSLTSDCFRICCPFCMDFHFSLHACHRMISYIGKDDSGVWNISHPCVTTQATCDVPLLDPKSLKTTRPAFAVTHP